MSDANKGKSTVIIILALLLVVAGGGYYAYTQFGGAMSGSTPHDQTSSQPTTSDSAEAPSTPAPEEMTMEQAQTEIAANALTLSPATEMLDAPSTEEALEPRVLGNPDAPVTIREHSSLTCGHCGQFHATSFKQIKTEYIDTGKVKIIYDDFPLNGPALHASMIARCVPRDKYFDYLALLFEKQEDWAYNAGYVAFLKQSSQLAGLSAAGFDACINNEELRQGLLDNVRESQQRSNVRSTPSFVFEDGSVMTGAQPFGAFKTAIDSRLNQPASDNDAENNAGESEADAE